MFSFPFSFQISDRKLIAYDKLNMSLKKQLSILTYNVQMQY